MYRKRYVTHQIIFIFSVYNTFLFVLPQFQCLTLSYHTIAHTISIYIYSLWNIVSLLSSISLYESYKYVKGDDRASPSPFIVSLSLYVINFYCNVERKFDYTQVGCQVIIINITQDNLDIYLYISYVFMFIGANQNL